MSLKERISDSLKKVVGILKCFPVTLIFIGILTLFLAIFLDTEVFSNRVMINVLILLFTFIIGSFSVGLYLKNNKKIRIILYFLSFIISVLFSLFYDRSSGIGREYFYRIYVTYISIISIFSLYILYRNSKLSIERYFIQVAFNLFKVSVVYYILSTGTILITSLFSFLILGSEAYSLIWRVLIIVFGFIYIPGIIFAFINKDPEIIKFVRFIVKYIMTILLIIAFLIIYAYMLKILVLWRIPSNQIFRILSILFIFGFPIWTMCYNFKNEKGLIDKINEKLPILFIPFIFLQIYSIFTRIYNYGLTETRYICVIFLLVEIIYIIIYIINKNKIYYLFMIISSLVIITLLVPKINMFDVSYKSQSNIIKKYLIKENLSDKEILAIKSSYNSIKSNYTGKEFIKANFSEEENTKLQKYLRRSDIYISESVSFYGEVENEIIEVNGYKTLEAFDESYNSDSKSFLKSININSNKYNLSKVLETYKKNQKHFENYFKKDDNNKIVIDSNTKIVLNYIYYSYDNNQYELNIRGYVLKK